jgi:hypothetical protein
MAQAQRRTATHNRMMLPIKPSLWCNTQSHGLQALPLVPEIQPAECGPPFAHGTDELEETAEEGHQDELVALIEVRASAPDSVKQNGEHETKTATHESVCMPLRLCIVSNPGLVCAELRGGSVSHARIMPYQSLSALAHGAMERPLVR